MNILCNPQDIIIESTTDDISSHAGLCAINKILSNCPSIGDIDDNELKNNSLKKRILDSTIVKATIGMLCVGKTNFSDIEVLNKDTLFNYLIDGKNISEETLRQRLDLLSKQEGIQERIDDILIDILKMSNFSKVNYAGKEYIPVDIDVTPFENSNCKKEGIEYTYKKYYGYAPIMSYIGGVALKFELRPGSQHSEKGAPEFLKRCFEIIKSSGVNLSEIIVRADSAHDAVQFLKMCEEYNVKFIIKCNNRGAKEYTSNNAIERAKLMKIKPKKSKHIKGKIYYRYYVDDKPKVLKKFDDIYKVVEAIEYTCNEYGQLYLKGVMPCEVNCFWSNLEYKRLEEIIKLYHDHATSEQYHSELKSDMYIEKLPSGKFKTNYLILQIAAISFAILRMIGNIAIKEDKSYQHHKDKITKRIRLRTVIQDFCYLACKIVRHARRVFLKICDIDILKTFKIIYNRC